MATPKAILEFSIQSSAGQFLFTDFEVPSTLDSLGTDEVSTLHQFPGGRRVIQTFGGVPRDALTWSGIIFGPDSFARFKQLNALVGPNLATLTYGPFKWSGIFKSCKGTPGFEGYIPYHGTFIPSAELSSQGLVPQQTLGQTTVVATGQQDCLQAANSALAGSDTPAVQFMAQALIAAANAIDPNNYGGSLSAFSAAAATQYAFLQTAVNMDDAVLVLQMYVNTNIILTALGTVTSPQVTFITVDNPNLFRLAARYYGDATQWGIISAANGYLDPFNYGTYNLIIPLNPETNA